MYWERSDLPNLLSVWKGQLVGLLGIAFWFVMLAEEWIEYGQAVIVRAVLHVLAQQYCAADLAQRRQQHAIPVLQSARCGLRQSPCHSRGAWCHGWENFNQVGGMHGWIFRRLRIDASRGDKELADGLKYQVAIGLTGSRKGLMGLLVSLASR